MNLAVIAVTRQGAAVARRVADSLRATGCTVTEYGKAGKTLDGAQRAFESLLPVVAELFCVVDGFVFVAATGIVVRAIAPHLRHKGVDPAVVIVDDQGRFAVSLLSGHLGGANDLARLVADRNGLMPVITTATDGLQVVAPDLLAARWGLRLEPQTAIRPVNAALAAQEPVPVWIEPDLPDYERWQSRMSRLPGLGKGLTPTMPAQGARVIVSDKALAPAADQLILRPPTLVAGIGCRRGTAPADLLAALNRTLADSGFSFQSVCRLATAWVKADEPGLLAVAQAQGVPLVCYERAALQKTITQFCLTESAFVKQEIGVGNVCEAAALSGPETVQLITKKTRCGGITVALARGNFMSWASAPDPWKI